MTIIEGRLAELDTIDLAEGAHEKFEDGVCLLELSSYLAGEPFSDHPECVSTVLGAFGRSWNDQLDDETRQRLKPYAARFIGTKSTPEVELARSWMACDWLVRVFTPTWLRRAGLVDDAVALEALPVLSSSEQLVDAAMPVLERARGSAAAAGAAAGAAAREAARTAARTAAREAAWDAARAAARTAAREAAWDAARAAAREAARAAAWAAVGEAAGAAAREAARTAARTAAREAAWDAARAAARTAAREAAWDAARAAAREAARAAAWAAVGEAAGAALAPTVLVLQESAFDLLDRMVRV